MNVGYIVWCENMRSPLIKGQVLQVLKAVQGLESRLSINLIAFIPFYRLLLDHRYYSELKAEMAERRIRFYGIPALVFPGLKLTSPKWYEIPFVLIYGLPVLWALAALKKIRILHCRSYPIMVSALLLKSVSKATALVFDPRSPFPEEQVTAARWEEGSRSDRAWRYLERKSLEASDVVIAIAGTYVEHYRKISRNTRYETVPNNVDTEMFRPDEEDRERLRQEMGIGRDEQVFAYLGSLGGHWNNPKVYSSLAKAMRELPASHRFLFITRDRKEVEKEMDESGIDASEYIVIEAGHEAVPRYLNIADFGLNVMGTRDIRMSVKTVEYLAMGLPLIVNEKVMGAAETVREYGVGMVIDLDELDLGGVERLMARRPALSGKCREVANREFSTHAVSGKYLEIYESLLERCR